MSQHRHIPGHNQLADSLVELPVGHARVEFNQHIPAARQRQRLAALQGLCQTLIIIGLMTRQYFKISVNRLGPGVQPVRQLCQPPAPSSSGIMGRGNDSADPLAVCHGQHCLRLFHAAGSVVHALPGVDEFIKIADKPVGVNRIAAPPFDDNIRDLIFYQRPVKPVVHNPQRISGTGFLRIFIEQIRHLCQRNAAALFLHQHRQHLFCFATREVNNPAIHVYIKAVKGLDIHPSFPSIHLYTSLCVNNCGLSCNGIS